MIGVHFAALVERLGTTDKGRSILNDIDVEYCSWMVIKCAHLAWLYVMPTTMHL